MEIINNINKVVNDYKSTETVDNSNMKQLCLNLWMFCMGWIKYESGKDLLSLIDTNCNELYAFLKQNKKIQLIMQLLKICLAIHKKSIDELLEESQGIVVFNDIYSKNESNSNNQNIKTFWETFEILNLCMNSILCISWSQRNSSEIKNNPLFIEYFYINKEPLFVHLFNYIAQDNYCDKMPIKKFITYIKWHLCLVFLSLSLSASFTSHAQNTQFLAVKLVRN